MSMDGFNDSFGGPPPPDTAGEGSPGGEGEADPAAEFLAREQEELAGLEDDIKPVVTNGISSAEDKDGLGLGGENEFDSGFEMVNHSSVETATLGNGNSNQDFEFNNDHDRRSPSPSFSQPKLPREEPEKIKRWREEQQERLERKDEDEEKRKGEMREAARKELDEWYKTHDEQVIKTRNTNRSAEKELVAETEPMEPGTEWERIAKLCDFNPKASKHTKDISRMRSIILQVKQTPNVKPKPQK